MANNPPLAGRESDGTIREVLTDADGHLQIDVLTGGGAGTQYTEDAAAAADPVGGVQILVRDDAPGVLTSTDGDNVAQRGTNYGAAFVQVVNSSGNFIDSFGGSGGTSEVDDSAFTVATDSGTPIMGVVTADTVDSGDVGVVGMDTSRNLKVSIEADNAGIGGGQTNTTSTNNSTTTPLAGDATFTGTGDDVSAYTSVTITLDASHDSTTDGMTFQFSTDDTNWDDVYSFTYTAASGARRFQFPVTASYFRVVFTNTSTLQTHFRVQTILHRNNVLTSIHRLSNDMSPDRSAQVVKSVLFAQAAGSGDFTAVDATAGGNLKTSISEISDGLDIGAGDAGAETQRVSISTNDVNMSAIKTATETVAGDTTSIDTKLVSGTVIGAVEITDTSFAVADGNALGEGVLIQGDDGTDRKNINVDATTGNVQVDVVSSALPTGAATAAGQLPAGHDVTIDNAAGAAAVNIQDGGNTITVDGTVTADAGTGTFAVSNASMDTVAGAVAAGQMQVDIVADGAGLATAANQLANGHDVTVDNTTGSPANVQIGDGTSQATVRNLAANDSLNVAIVDGSGDQITSFGGGTQYTVDDAGPTVVTMAGAVRDDTLTTLTEVDGDATLLRVNSTGALHVTGAGGGTQYSIDDPAPTVVTMAGAIRDDTLTTLTEADGDASTLRVSSTGALHVTGGGGGTEYTEDVATANPIIGTATLMERDDALTTVTPVEGDWIGLRGSAEGALWTQDFNSDAILSDTTAILEDTANMDTNLGTVAGAVAAGQMQVDIVADGADLLTNTTHDAAFGTAGTADAQVRSIQGIAGMTAVIVDGSGVTQPVSGTVTANPASGTIDTVTNVVQFNGQAVSMGTGVRDAGTQRVTIATNDSVPVTGTVTVTATDLDVQSGGADLATSAQGAAIQAAVEIMDDWDETNRCAVNPISGVVGIAGGTGADATNVTRVSLATDIPLPAGTNGIGKLTANSGVDIGDVDVTSISAGNNLIGDVGISGARTSGGTTLYMDPDLDETKVEVKGTGGQLYWIHAMNLTSAVLYLKFWNLAAASVTVGTTTPHLIFPLATQGDANGAGFTLSIPNGIAMGTGITMACVTSVLDAGNSGPAANGCVVNLGYA